MPIVTKNIELYFQQAPVADLTALAAIDTTGIVDGVTIEVSDAGIFKFQLPAVAVADGLNVITGFDGGVWIRQTLPALKATATGLIAPAMLATIANSAVLVTSNAGVASWATSLTQNTSGNATTATTATNIASGIANDIPYQTAVGVTSFIAPVNSSVLVSGATGIPSMLAAGTTGQFLSASTSGTPAWSTATYPQTSTANQLLYSSAANVVGGLATGNDSVLVTSASGVPSLSTTLPGVTAGSVLVTNPTTATQTTINTALSNVYTAVHANSSAVGTLAADSTAITGQIVTGAQLVLAAGTYLISYSAAQSLTTQVADATKAFTATAYIYNTTGVATIAGTTFKSFSGYAATGSEIFGGTANATVVATFAVTTTLDVYVQLSAASVSADTYSVNATITAVNLG